MPGVLDYAEPTGAPVGTVVQIPLGSRTVDGIIVERASESEIPAERLKAVSAVEPRSTTEELVQVARWLADDVASTTARALQLVAPPVQQARQRLWAYPEVEAVPEEERLTDAQRELLTALIASGARPAGADLARLRTLERRGLVRLSATDERRAPRARAVGSASSIAPAMTDDQQAALARVEEVAAQPDGGALLLHGVTGSGKTEVYLRAAAAQLERGRTVLVLVPEIGLTPQTAHRFRERFGEIVAVMHSGLSAGERRDEWWRVRNGEAQIVVGARSAVFAPLAHLGLVIVDEEHDASYKSGEDPRYDARRVAAWRARHSGAVLLCGSATPRAESAASLEVIRMERRVDGRGMPAVEIVDMRGVTGPLHPETRNALVDSRKAIVLLNRRGWSNFLECQACGHAFGCPHCDVTLVLHRSRGRMDCHHCGYTEPVPGSCPSCGSVSIARHGVGTERLEEELRSIGLQVLRVDADVRDPGAVLEAFGAATHAVLVGTQLVAKGHDFPDVELAVILDADSTLRFPDFRSEERTFQLITQLAGRAGRGGEGSGRVLVQTTAPQHPVIGSAAAHDADGFLAGELARRRAHAYPPYSTMVRVVVSHPSQDVARELAREIARGIARQEIGEVLGPAPLFRVRGLEREQVLVKAQYRGQVVAAVRESVGAVQRRASQRRAQLSIDVAPQ